MEPTDRELEALKVLWACCEAGQPGGTVHQVCDGINAAGDDTLAYTTVLSLLQVMEQKGLVDHVRQGRAYIYRPLIERQSTFRRLASGFLNKVFDGAIDQYLVHALENRRLSAGELDQLEAMIAQARASQPQATPPSKPAVKRRKEGKSR